jgi:hypothetical protein
MVLLSVAWNAYLILLIQFILVFLVTKVISSETSWCVRVGEESNSDFSTSLPVLNPVSKVIRLFASAPLNERR